MTLVMGGFTPEAVYTYTSATFEKRKKKRHVTPFGTFTYRDIPAKAFAYGVDIIREGDYCYKIATAEKALCDQLYKMKKVANYTQLRSLLFEDLRIEESDLQKLNAENIAGLAKLYGDTNVKRLSGWMKKYGQENHTN